MGKPCQENHILISETRVVLWHIYKQRDEETGFNIWQPLSSKTSYTEGSVKKDPLVKQVYK